MIQVSLVEVSLLHQFTWYWDHEFCSSDERGSILRPREILKHTSLREPVIWPEVKLAAPFGLWSSVSCNMLPTQLNTLFWIYWLCIPTAHTGD